DAKQAVGLEWIQTVKARHPHTPLVAIGGITTHNAASVINAGADGVSVISAITKSPNIKATVTKL
ncbi:MAG TPA: thiamine phosphate synthase, partial [Virgibacillus sp.]|nr:thiamine phosphate synthase [Virgibacillus sp.]